MVNVRIGKIYELHFGKDIFVKYKIILLDLKIKWLFLNVLTVYIVDLR